jgi:hypothetical protein
MEEQLARYGLDESFLPEHIRKPADVAVWPEHETDVRLFLSMTTQWRAGPAGLLGFDYGVLFEMMRIYNVRDRRQSLENLQVMEAHALQLIDEAGKKKAARQRP